MKKKNHYTVIFLDKKKFYFLAPNAQDFQVLEFKDAILKDLEVQDEQIFKSQLKKFVEEQKLTPNGTILVLSKNVLFSQELRESEKVTEEAQIKEFMHMVPFESAYAKTVEFGKQKKVVVINRGFYEPLLEILSELKFDIGMMIDQESMEVVLGVEKFGLEVANLLIKSLDDFKNYNFLAEEKVRHKLTIKAEPEDKERIDNRTLYLGLVFFFLLLILFGMLIWSRGQTESIPAAPVDYSQTEQQASKAKQNTSAEEPTQQAVNDSTSQDVTEASDSTKLGDLSQLNLDKIKIQIYNGSGIAGQAEDIKITLEEAGFSKINTENAANINLSKTLVMFAANIPQELRTKILEKLKTFDDNYLVQENSELQNEVVITTSTQKE